MKKAWGPAPDTASVDAHLADTSDAHDAAAVSVVPAGGIASTDVQAALQELDAEKVAAAHASDPDAHFEMAHPLYAAPPISFTNLGAGPTDPSSSQHAVLDLSRFSEMQILVNQTVSGGGTGDLKLQYATDDATWTDLGAVSIDLATPAAIKVSSWVSIPAGAKSAPVGIRAVGVDGNSTEDHTIKYVGIRLR